MTTETILPPDLEAAIARDAEQERPEIHRAWMFDWNTPGHEIVTRELVAFAQRIARLAWEARGAADGWRDIESAPKGTPLLMYRPALPARDRLAVRQVGDWCGASCCPSGKPTHWQPLPPPPSRPSDEPAQEPGA